MQTNNQKPTDEITLLKKQHIFVPPCGCGAMPIMKTIWYQSDDDLFWLECPVCKNEGNNSDSKIRAAYNWAQAAWNARASTPKATEPEGELERVKAAWATLWIEDGQHDRCLPPNPYVVLLRDLLPENSIDKLAQAAIAALPTPLKAAAGEIQKLKELINDFYDMIWEGVSEHEQEETKQRIRTITNR